jgi:hypothetical protein
MSEAVVKRGRGRPRKDSVTQNINVVNNNKAKVVTETISNNNNITSEPINSNNIVGENVKPKNIYSYIKPNAEENDEDLKQFLRQSKKENKMSNDTNIDYTQNDLDEQILLDVENIDINSSTDDITEEEFDPLEESVKQRGYTGGINQKSQDKINTNIEEKIIEEPQYNTGNTSAQIEVDSNLFNPNNNQNSNQNNSSSNDIPNDTKSNDNNKSSNSSSNNSNGESNSKSTNTEKKPVQENDNLKELTPKEKRDAIEKTTDSILLAYKNYMPLPFIYFASYNIKKLQKLHDTDEIDLDTEVRRDGTTFIQSAKEHNNKVEKTFEISNEEIEALREPLFDVLMEQDIAFTPTQRLFFVAGQLVVAKTMGAVKLWKEQKDGIEEMKIIHKEKMDEMRRQYEDNVIRKKSRPQQSNNVTYTTPPASTSSPRSTTQPNDDIEDKKYVNNNKVDSDEDDEATIVAKNDISKEEVVNFTEIKDTTPNSYINNTPTLDDVLNIQTETEEDLEEDIETDNETNNDIPE